MKKPRKKRLALACFSFCVLATSSCDFPFPSFPPFSSSASSSESSEPLTSSQDSSSENELSTSGDSSKEDSDSSLTEEGESDPISFHFLTLGNANNGDSIYIKAGENDILIDAGSKQGSAETIASALKEYVSDGKLEYVICTHAHSDHYTGMFGNVDKSLPGGKTGILYQFEVGQLIDFSYLFKTTKESPKKELLLRNNEITSDLFPETSEPYKYVLARDYAVSKGTVWTPIDVLESQFPDSNPRFDLGKNLWMEFLRTDFHSKGSTNENNNSVVTLFHQGDSEFLFTGDLEEQGVSSLLAMNPSLGHVKLFKAGHHGSINANPDSLYSAITPEVVAISASAGVSEYTVDGDNVMPYQSTIDIIAKYTSNVFCTTYGEFKNKLKVVGTPFDLNGRINLYYESGVGSVANSASDAILKDSPWFSKTGDIYAAADSTRPNRIWPNVQSLYSAPLPRYSPAF